MSALCPTCLTRGCGCRTARVPGVRSDPHSEALAFDAQWTACRALQAASETRYAVATAAARKAGAARKGIVPAGFTAQIRALRALGTAKAALRQRPVLDSAAPCAWCRGQRLGASRWCSERCKGADRRDREKHGAMRRSA